jgi:RNA polymerase sigma-70 factor, ECF subfamily
VQEAWLRLQAAAAREPIRNLGPWLTTTVSRLALDAIGSARARKRVRLAGPRAPSTRGQQMELFDAFTRACFDGDMKRLAELLDPDVVWRADGGGKVRAFPQFARGAVRIARLCVSYARRPPLQSRTVLVNGAPGLVLRDADGVLSVMAVTVDAGRIVAIDMIRNPDKLAVAAALLAGSAD